MQQQQRHRSRRPLLLLTLQLQPQTQPRMTAKGPGRQEGWVHQVQLLLEHQRLCMTLTLLPASLGWLCGWFAIASSCGCLWQQS